VVGGSRSRRTSKAIENKVTLAFVANQNLKNLKIGTPAVRAYGPGVVPQGRHRQAVLDGEVRTCIPHDESIQRVSCSRVDVSEGRERSSAVLRLEAAMVSVARPRAIGFRGLMEKRFDWPNL